MIHLPYPKIPTRRDGSAAAPSGPWVATEKIHGAQLVVGTDGREVRFGKRKAWLERGEPFFGWQLLRPMLEEAALALRRRVDARGVVYLYGELHGGAYPHPDVAAVPGASAVQTGVWYAPDVRFALFDVLVVEDDHGLFLSDSEVRRIASSCGLTVVPLVRHASRREIEAEDARGETRVPRSLGLPWIEGNVREGLVLKPDARSTPADRYAVKIKIAEFDEARFDASLPWDPHAPLAWGDLLALVRHLLPNPARLASARSKIGEDERLVREEAALDVLADLEAVFPIAFAALGDEDERMLREYAETLAS